jgi:hypothetical protein
VSTKLARAPTSSSAVRAAVSAAKLPYSTVASDFEMPSSADSRRLSLSIRSIERRVVRRRARNEPSERTAIEVSSPTRPSVM